jgi:predicted AlkP superfamily phosphohydrolase/phosphomutase
MTVLIGSWEFEGPFSEPNKLKSEPGIVAVLAKNNHEFELVDIDESESVREYVKKRVTAVPPPSNDIEFSTAVYYCADLSSALRQGLINKLMKEFDDESLECAS